MQIMKDIGLVCPTALAAGFQFVSGCSSFVAGFMYLVYIFNRIVCHVQYSVPAAGVQIVVPASDIGSAAGSCTLC